MQQIKNLIIVASIVPLSNCTRFEKEVDFDAELKETSTYQYVFSPAHDEDYYHLKNFSERPVSPLQKQGREKLDILIMNKFIHKLQNKHHKYTHLRQKSLYLSENILLSHSELTQQLDHFLQKSLKQKIYFYQAKDLPSHKMVREYLIKNGVKEDNIIESPYHGDMKFLSENGLFMSLIKISS